MYSSYELNAINNVTTSSGVYAFYIIGICPWIILPANLHKYVPLHSCSLHIIDIMIFTSVSDVEIV